MYKQPFYFEEGKKEIKNKQLIIFCVVIALITIGIIVFTGTLAYKMIKNDMDNQGMTEIGGAKTIGKETAENVEPSATPSESPEVEETPEPEPEVTPTPQVNSKFPT